MFDFLKIKEDFPVLSREIRGKRIVYLDSGATSQKPEQVILKMDDYYRNHNANIHRGVYELSVESTQMVDEARANVASFIGGDFDEVIFTRNTSESINLVMYSWGRENIKEGDAVITTKLEHHSNLVPWQELCKEKGAELRVIEIDDQGSLLMDGGEMRVLQENGLTVRVGSLMDLVDEKVKLLAITGQSNVLGTIPDLEKIIYQVRQKAKSTVILVDGAQMVPHMKVDVKKMGADFLAFSGHKMLGPTGIGVLWGRKSLLREMKPFLYGGDMISEVKLTGATWADLPSKFEAGTPDIAGIVGMGEAVTYLKKIGMDEVKRHEEDLMVYAMKEMTKLEKEGVVELYGPREIGKRGGAITFNVKGVHAHDTASILDSYGISVRSGQHCAGPLVTGFGVPAMVRATVYIYNTKEDIDYLTDKIREVPKVFF